MIALLDHQALLAAILEHPEDDVSRLLLADLLQENGDAIEQLRGRFIHKQMSLWKKGWRVSLPVQLQEIHYRDFFGKEETSWIAEAEMLVRKYGRAWLADDLDAMFLWSNPPNLPDLSGIDPVPSSLRLPVEDHRTIDCSFVWLRGFPDRFTLSWEAWMVWGDRLRQTWPIGEVKLPGSLPLILYRPHPYLRLLEISLDAKTWWCFPPKDNLPEGFLVNQWLRQRWPGVRFTFKEE